MYPTISKTKLLMLNIHSTNRIHQTAPQNLGTPTPPNHRLPAQSLTQANPSFQSQPCLPIATCTIYMKPLLTHPPSLPIHHHCPSSPFHPTFKPTPHLLQRVTPLFQNLLNSSLPNKHNTKFKRTQTEKGKRRPSFLPSSYLGVDC